VNGSRGISGLLVPCGPGMESGKNERNQMETNETLNWVVVNPEGKLLAILDSESEAHWFTRNRGHAAGAFYFQAGLNYAHAGELLAALEALILGADELTDGQIDPSHGQEERDFQTALGTARAAIAKARGGAA